MNIQDFFTVDLLLTKIKVMNIDGKKVREDKLEKIFREYADLTAQRNFLDDLVSQQVVITTTGRYLQFKYWKSILELFDNYGLTTPERISAGNTFRYEGIDRRVKVGKEFQPGMELTEYFKRFYPLMTSINYFLKWHHQFSAIYSFNATETDIAFLLSMFYSTNDDLEEWSIKNFVHHLNRNNPNEELQKQFNERLAREKGKCPTFLMDDNWVFVGKQTLLFYSLYVMYNHSKHRFQEGKEVASKFFESEIRSYLRSKSYVVPFDREMKLRKDTGPSYDIIGFSPTKKEIILIEAKYKDIAPSSISGRTLVKQELEGTDGLLDESERQYKRIQFFNENIAEFSSRMNADLTGYKVRGLIVTKYTPLINENNGVELMSLTELELAF